MLSAYERRFAFVTPSVMPGVKDTNRSSPNTTPWGTPDFTSFFVEDVPMTCTVCCLWVRKLWSHNLKFSFEAGYL